MDPRDVAEMPYYWIEACNKAEAAEQWVEQELEKRRAGYGTSDPDG